MLEKAEESRTLYSYVPASALDAILKDGLHSGKSLLANPSSLAAAAKGRDKDPKVFEKEIRENLSTWKRYSSEGPNAVFHLIPPEAKLLENHPTKTNKLTPIAIDVDALLRDQPDTKFYGMELKPYEKSDKPGTRHHYIDDTKMRALHAQTPAAYWSTYNDIEKKGLYAPDVPHVAIHTPTGHVPAKYLKAVESTEKKGGRRAVSRALVIGAVLALVCALGAGGYRASYDCIGAHCGMVFVREGGRR